MLINQTVRANHRRVSKSNINSSTTKKTKKQQQNLSNESNCHRRKLRSGNSVSIETKTHRQESMPLKKERKKRTKKIDNINEQEITITQTKAKTTNNESKSLIYLIIS